MVLCRITRARDDVMLEQCRGIVRTTDDASAGSSSSLTSDDIDWLHGGGLKLTLWIAKIPLPAHNFLFVERLSNFLLLAPQIQSRAPLQSLTTSLRPHRNRWFHHPLFCCSACSGRRTTRRRNFLLPEFPKKEASYRRSDEDAAAKVSKLLSMEQPQTPQTSAQLRIITKSAGNLRYDSPCDVK